MLTSFILLYPLTMTLVWLIGTLFYRLTSPRPSQATHTDLVSVIVPCYNEEATLHETVQALCQQGHRNLELILVDDCSTDNTLLVMRALKQKFRRVPMTIVAQSQNGGKAAALNAGAKAANGEYILCVDSDSLIDPKAIDHLLSSLKADDRVGAVTGKPVVLNRGVIVEKMQTMEYVAIIDLIKRAQMFFTANILTLSGVLVLYRKAALQSVSGWNENVQTEDIDITWRMKLKKWRVAYQPQATTWILVPSTIKALLKQRQRWAYGGLQVLVANWRLLFRPWQPNTWLLYEMLTSILWSFGTLFSMTFFVVSTFMNQAVQLDGNVILMIFFIGLLQFFAGMLMSVKKAKLRLRMFLYTPMYLFFYWFLNLYSLVTAVLKMVYTPIEHGRWESADRSRSLGQMKGKTTDAR
ncbi:glycosyltransferase [Lacticaseibacillus parakribbianus]|uniref:glycosyltransferase n=1 Tax=Lacticaseibacillus parakribbianus TaxID=2970927 RepID=UPI0021CAFA97|nr:glycosyltransferase family 2 protein [Lacticaseibacillus parakribbianus]